MNKKISIALGILLSIIFAFTVCFANDGLEKAANDVRNVVGGVENTVENAAKDVSNTTRDMTGGAENTANSMMGNDNNDNSNTSFSGMMDGSNDGSRTVTGDGYTTSRVSTEDSSTFMGMNSTAWIWLIMGIAAIAIIAIVWYYAMQFTNTSGRNNDRLD